VLCPKCRNDNGRNKKFCSNCGTPLHLSSSQIRRERTCPQCGTALQDGRKFCVGCGTRVSPPSPQPLYSETTCHQCGASLKKNARFCSACGAVTGQSPLPAPPRVEAVSPTPAVVRQVTETWELPPWPRGLVPPPPPLSGAIHTFSIPSNVAKDVFSRLDVFGFLSRSEFGATLMGISKTCETILAELSRIVSEIRSILGHVSSSPTEKRKDAPVKSNTLSQPTRRCPNCHQAVAGDKKFCTGCGLLIT
jgi:predicted amidophosphoribosyltransferase